MMGFAKTCDTNPWTQYINCSAKKSDCYKQQRRRGRNKQMVWLDSRGAVSGMLCMPTQLIRDVLWMSLRRLVNVQFIRYVVFL